MAALHDLNSRRTRSAAGSGWRPARFFAAVIAIGTVMQSQPATPADKPGSVTAADLAFTAMPELHPTLSWIGNTFSGWSYPKRPIGEFFPLEIEDIAVAPDGTVATNGAYNEVGSAVQVYKDGAWVGTTGQQIVGGLHHAVVAMDPDGEYLFYSMAHTGVGTGAGRVLPSGKEDPRAAVSETCLTWPTRALLMNRIISGIAVRHNMVYLSDDTPPSATEPSPFNGIRILDKHSLQLLRSIPVSHPGKLAVTTAGDIWMIQESDHPEQHIPPQVVHISADGQIRGEVDGIGWPRGLAIDGRGRVLIADAGKDCDIKIVAADDKVVGTFGVKGGILSGVGPEIGRWGPARFERPCGVGVDAADNIYVACTGATWPEVGRLESYSPRGDSWGGAPRWTVMGLMFGDVAVPDPHDEDILYTSGSRLRMDWSGPPGREWSYAATTLDSNLYPQDPRLNIFAQGAAGRTTHGVRYIDGHRFLFSGANNVEVSRFDPGTTGEIGIPSVYVAMRDPRIDMANAGWPPGHPGGMNPWIWTDRNGDGQFDATEYEVAPRLGGCMGAARVDAAGNMWWLDSYNHCAWELPVEGHLDSHGNPIYRAAQARRIALPGDYTRGRALFTMDDRTGDLYVAGVRTGDTSYSLARYAGWRESRVSSPTWLISDFADHVRHEVWHVKPSDFGGLAVCGKYVFAASAISDIVRVYRIDDGAPVGKMQGPASLSTVDTSQSFNVFQRTNGEYDVLVMDYLHNKNVLFRWRPDDG
jgi:hypothetical protein